MKSLRKITLTSLLITAAAISANAFTKEFMAECINIVKMASDSNLVDIVKSQNKISEINNIGYALNQIIVKFGIPSDEIAIPGETLEIPSETNENPLLNYNNQTLKEQNLNRYYQIQKELDDKVLELQKDHDIIEYLSHIKSQLDGLQALCKKKNYEMHCHNIRVARSKLKRIHILLCEKNPVERFQRPVTIENEQNPKENVSVSSNGIKKNEGKMARSKSKDSTALSIAQYTANQIIKDEKERIKYTKLIKRANEKINSIYSKNYRNTALGKANILYNFYCLPKVNIKSLASSKKHIEELYDFELNNNYNNSSEYIRDKLQEKRVKFSDYIRIKTKAKKTYKSKQKLIDRLAELDKEQNFYKNADELLAEFAQYYELSTKKPNQYQPPIKLKIGEIYNKIILAKSKNMRAKFCSIVDIKSISEVISINTEATLDTKNEGALTLHKLFINSQQYDKELATAISEFILFKCKNI